MNIEDNKACVVIIPEENQSVVGGNTLKIDPKVDAFCKKYWLTVEMGIRIQKA
jgi:hypothetical protein